MINFSQINGLFGVGMIIGTVLGGGVAAFFIIRVQLTKVLQEEVKAYKDKVDRLTKDMEALTISLGIVKSENLSLISERDYLKSLIISAINSKKDIHHELLQELKKPINDTQLYNIEIKKEK